MTALVITLVLTNAVTVAGLIAVVRRRSARTPHDEPIIDAVTATPRPLAPSTAVGRTRRVISVEILNPMELAGARGRMFGIAGSLVPHLTRRIVHDQVVRQLREQLTAHHVVADVRIHVLPPVAGLRAAPMEPAQPIRLDIEVDEPTAVTVDPGYEPPV